MFLDPETSHFPSFYCKRPDTPYLRVTYIMEWVSRSYFFVHLAQTVKNLPANQETWFQPLGQEDPLEKGMATHSNILAWRIPWTEEPGGVIKSQTWLSDSHLTLSSFLVKASLCWAFDRGADRASVFRLCNREKKKKHEELYAFYYFSDFKFFTQQILCYIWNPWYCMNIYDFSHSRYLDVP